MHVVVDGVDAETAIFVGAVVQKQATYITVLQVDMLDGLCPAILRNLVDHAQTVHQILHKGELHLVRACVRNVKVIVRNDVHVTLGEISPDEFRGFIGPNMRLEPVILRYDFGIKELLEYYMGKNTMERQKFIIDNLRIEDDSEMDKI